MPRKDGLLALRSYCCSCSGCDGYGGVILELLRVQFRLRAVLRLVCGLRFRASRLLVLGELFVILSWVWRC